MSEPILAIETSAKNCGVAIYFDEHTYFEENVLEERSHSRIIFSLIEKCMQSAGVKLSECAAVAVSMGPGSFTGLRIGLSAAKGIAFGANLPIIPAPTFEAAALQIAAEQNESARFMVSAKVNSEEVYLQSFRNTGTSIDFDDLKIVTREELKATEKSIPIYTEIDLKERGNYHYFSSPSSVSIAKWAKQFGGEKKLYDFDTLEPYYIKDFVIKRKVK